MNDKNNNDNDRIRPELEWIVVFFKCKLCNNKCMIASTQITNTEIFAFIAVLVIEPWSLVY